MIPYLYPYIIVQYLILGLILLTGYRNKGIIFLSCFLIGSAIQHGLIYAEQMIPSFGKIAPYTLPLLDSGAFAKFSCLMFYFNSLLDKPALKWQKLAWFASPVVLIIMTTALVTSKNPYSTQFYYSNLRFFLFYIHVITIGIFYVIYQLRVFNQYLLNTPDISNHKKINIYWGKLFVYYLAVRYLIAVVYNTYIFFDKENTIFEMYYISIMGVLSLILSIIMVYLALRNPQVFNRKTEQVTLEQRIAEAVLPREEKVVSKKIPFSDEIIEQYKEVLMKALIEEKVYLQNDLNLRKLAQDINVPPHHLTHLINTYLGQNFNELINGYRVENAKKMLADKSKAAYTIYSVALESGFNSESVFYSAFKQKTGYTPKEYKALFQNS